MVDIRNGIGAETHCSMDAEKIRKKRSRVMGTLLAGSISTRAELTLYDISIMLRR